MSELANWEAGGCNALYPLAPLIYRELRRQAHRYLRDERLGTRCKPRLLYMKPFCGCTIRNRLTTRIALTFL